MPARGSTKQPLGERAYRQIRERILTLKLRPGEQIEESVLEQQLSIGRTPIREALQRLSGERLLDSVPGRGFFVKPISIDDIKSLFEALTIFERVAVHLAAERINSELIDRLIDLNELHEAAMVKKDFLKVTVHNTAFHSTLYRATRNDFIQRALDGIYHQAERVGYLTYTKEAHPTGMDAFNRKAVEDHKALIECFKAGDAEKAVEVITEHCRRFFLRICYYMEPRVPPLETFLDDNFGLDIE